MQIVSGCSLVVSVALWGSSSGHLSVQLNWCAHSSNSCHMCSYQLINHIKRDLYGKVRKHTPIIQRTIGAYADMQLLERAAKGNVNHLSSSKLLLIFAGLAVYLPSFNLSHPWLVPIYSGRWRQKNDVCNWLVWGHSLWALNLWGPDHQSNDLHIDVTLAEINFQK